jgi:hypothetical protein
MENKPPESRSQSGAPVPGEEPENPIYEVEYTPKALEVYNRLNTVVEGAQRMIDSAQNDVDRSTATSRRDLAAAKLQKLINQLGGLPMTHREATGDSAQEQETEAMPPVGIMQPGIAFLFERLREARASLDNAREVEAMAKAAPEKKLAKQRVTEAEKEHAAALEEFERAREELPDESP